MRVVPAAAGAAALLLISSGIAAQEPRDSVADSTRRIERIVVRAARQPATVGGTGAVVLRPDSLRGSSAPLLEEALREMPFVLVRQNSRGEMELSVRGSDSRQAAVMVDGVPLTIGWDHRTDPSLVPLSGVQSLMLVRGLSSLLHGPNVLGGIVELGIGRGASAGSRRESAWAAAGVDYTGAYALSTGGAAPIQLGSGTFTLRGGGGYRRREGFRLPASARDTFSTGALRAGSDLEHADAFGAVRWDGDGGRHAGLTATGYRATRGVPPELHVSSPRLWRYPHQARALVALSAGSGPFGTPFGIGTADVATGYVAGSTEIQSFSDARYTSIEGRELGDEATANVRLLLRHSVKGGGALRAGITGADVRYLETIDGATSRYRQTLWSAGSEAELPAGGRASVGGGLVYDAAATPVTGGRETLGSLHAIGWRAGGTVMASETVRLHSSVSSRSRFPALRELYSGALARFRPNPALRPERLTGIEAGATYDAGAETARSGAGTLQVVAFHHVLDDAVVRTTAPGTRMFVRVNRDRIRSSGLELVGAWRSSQSARAVSIGGDLLAQHVRVQDDSARAERRPEHQPELRGSLELGMPLVAGARGTAGVRFTGRQYCVNPDTESLQQLDAHAEGSIAIERRWRLAGRVLDGLRVLLAIDNVTDALAYDQCGLPQPGRTLRLGIRFD